MNPLLTQVEEQLPSQIGPSGLGWSNKPEFEFRRFPQTENMK